MTTVVANMCDVRTAQLWRTKQTKSASFSTFFSLKGTEMSDDLPKWKITLWIFCHLEAELLYWNPWLQHAAGEDGDLQDKQINSIKKTFFIIWGLTVIRLPKAQLVKSSWTDLFSITEPWKKAKTKNKKTNSFPRVFSLQHSWFHLQTSVTIC